MCCATGAPAVEQHCTACNQTRKTATAQEQEGAHSLRRSAWQPVRPLLNSFCWSNWPRMMRVMLHNV